MSPYMSEYGHGVLYAIIWARSEGTFGLWELSPYLQRNKSYIINSEFSKKNHENWNISSKRTCPQMKFCMSVATYQGYLEPKNEGSSCREKKVSLIARSQPFTGCRTHNPWDNQKILNPAKSLGLYLQKLFLRFFYIATVGVSRWQNVFFQISPKTTFLTIFLKNFTNNLPK